MLIGVIQRLRIALKTPKRLVLREYPLIEWLMVGAVLFGVVNTAIMGLYLTAVGALVIGAAIALVSRMRVIDFDLTHETMIVSYRYPLKTRIVNSVPLDQIQRAYLLKEDDEYTQIVLVTVMGEMGLSVYSKDIRPWKEDLVLAINEILHAYRLKKQSERQDDVEHVPLT